MAHAPKTTRLHRLAATTDRVLDRYSTPLLIGTLIYLVCWHSLILGFTSWDGFVSRVPPVIELLQSGHLNTWKFDCSFTEYRIPMLEIVHWPFLRLFGLAGLYLSFPLTLLPLATYFVYRLGREVLGENRSALYSALAFLSLPFVNEQPFGGYIDFAVVGIFALFLERLLRAAKSELTTAREALLLFLATAMFTLSREHAVYIAVTVGTGCGISRLLRLRGRLLRAQMLSTLGYASPILIGILPEAVLQVFRWVRYGSPIHPYQFRFMGLETSRGISMLDTLRWAGRSDDRVGTAAGTFFRSWLWPSDWPTALFDSRQFGAGITMWVAILILPFVWTRLGSRERATLTGLLLVSIMSGGVWLPRFSMALVVVCVLIVGHGVGSLVGTRHSWLFLAIVALLIAQLGLRPAYVAWIVTRGDHYYPRADFLRSPVFLRGGPEVTETLPDLNASLLIVHPLHNKFSLQLYGRKVTNRIKWTLPATEAVTQDTCVELLRESRRAGPVLIIDHGKRAVDKCSLRCVDPTPWGCPAYSLFPPSTSSR